MQDSEAKIDQLLVERIFLKQAQRLTIIFCREL